MATNHTQNYALNQWELSDSVVMADFNADNQKVDAALTNLNQRIDTTAADAEQRLNAVTDQIRTTIPHVRAGTYVGTGTSGKANPNTLTFDFQPLFLAIVTEGDLPSHNSYRVFPRLFVRPWRQTNSSYYSGDTRNSYYTYVTWLDNGLSWYTEYDDDREGPPDEQLNKSGTTYHYIAIG